ncbi:MAG: hypothetical protein HC890_12440 [Chloroflexaceae bacterium]|nr:hypothetical protein [Chloroflexaceae bacterium]
MQGSLVSEVQSVQGGTPFWVALHLKIREGWHVYWQNPGDSGTAPIIKWALPAPGLQQGQVQSVAFFPHEDGAIAASQSGIKC